mmetsp:Transcript_31684/g.122654  ORF Transcript_31684/g.122654 Transcript_31684/m.122654 type:complete len:96 (+) Transcript_31684:1794-2081(+)
MLMQMEEPDGGSLKIGESVNFMYVDQSREGLDAEKTVFEEVTNNDDEITLGTRTVNSRAYLGVSFVTSVELTVVLFGICTADTLLATNITIVVQL